MLPLSFTEMLADHLQCANLQELALKTINDDVTTSENMLIKLLDFIKKSADEVVSLVKKNDSKQDADKRKEEMVKSKKFAQQMENEKKLKSQSQQASSDCNYLFTAKHKCIVAMKSYATLDAFAEAKTQNKHPPGNPYTITTVTVVDDKIKDRQVRSALGIFRVQCPSSATMANEGRAQMPLSVPGAAALREAMISAAPSNMQVPATWANTVAAKAFSMVSLHNFFPMSSPP